MAEYVLSLSYGKDSLACLGAIELLGWPLDRIVHAEVWATETIPADLPPMVEFKAKADKIIKDRYGIEVEHYRSKWTFEQAFHLVRGQSGRNTKHAGAIRGWPMTRGNWCLQYLKTSAINAVKTSPDTVHYIGIAADEPNRFGTLTDKKKSPLVERGWTEADCMEWCIFHDLVSPIYSQSTRGGCWFCHNQSVHQLRLLRQHYPEYWALMLQWDLESPVTFRSDGRTLHDVERRFLLEDEGFLKPGEVFHWKQLDEEPQFRLF